MLDCRFLQSNRSQPGLEIFCRKVVQCGRFLARLAHSEESVSLQKAAVFVNFSLVVFCTDRRIGHIAETTCCLAKIAAKTSEADCPRCNRS